MYYVLADHVTGELIQVSPDFIVQGEGQIVKCRQGDIPDLALFEWHNGSLAFLPKNMSRTLTKLAFMRRFQQQELATVYTLVNTELQVQIWMDMFRLAEEINLDDPLISEGIHSFEAMGVLAAGRAAEILA